MTSPELSTAQLSARTGLPAGTLRMWESRHGFPSPARLPGGHRRYSQRDAEAVLEVLRLREQGLSLPAAIERARRQEQPSERSVFAGLRRRRPDLAATVARSGCWWRCRMRSRTSASPMPVADSCSAASSARSSSTPPSRGGANWPAPPGSRSPSPTSPRSRSPSWRAAQVPLQIHHPMAREWTLIVDAPGAHACLTAWEHPGDGDLPDHARRFEVIWSFEREIVRAASEVATELLNDLAPEIAARVPDAIADGSGGDGLRFGSALAHRMVEYVAELVHGPVPAPSPGPEPSSGPAARRRISRAPTAPGSRRASRPSAPPRRPARA